MSTLTPDTHRHSADLANQNFDTHFRPLGDPREAADLLASAAVTSFACDLIAVLRDDT